MFDASHRLRAFSFGQDRYKRCYWALPHLGGMFVEGMESCELEDENITEAEREEKCPPPEVKVRDWMLEISKSFGGGGGEVLRK